MPSPPITQTPVPLPKIPGYTPPASLQQQQQQQSQPAAAVQPAATEPTTIDTPMLDHVPAAPAAPSPVPLPTIPTPRTTTPVPLPPNLFDSLSEQPKRTTSTSRATSQHPTDPAQQPQQQQQQQQQQPLVTSSSKSETTNTQTQQQIQMPAEPPLHGAPVRQYLNSKVTGVLLEGMKLLAREQPKDPLRVLGEYFLQRSREVEGTGTGTGTGNTNGNVIGIGNGTTTAAAGNT
ncbi:putative dpy-30 domain-protein [Cladorrhinum sp. PSN259]|nr:putative dpy-30 domain-protein [Cladorrhinum sp. PSN259]